MAMTIGEASAVATLLRAVTGETNGQDIDTDRLAKAMHDLNERAAKAMQLSRIVHTSHAIDVAADQLAQRYADSLGGA